MESFTDAQEQVHTLNVVNNVARMHSCTNARINERWADLKQRTGSVVNPSLGGELQEVPKSFKVSSQERNSTLQIIEDVF